MRKNIVFFIVVVLVCSAMIACTQQDKITTTSETAGIETASAEAVETSSSTIAEEQSDQMLVAGVPTLLNSLDFEFPMLAGGQVIALMRDKGLRWGEQPYPYDQDLADWGVVYPDFTKTEPRLIESYEVADDAKSAIFHLRKGVTSQWGNEMTTDDVVYTLERAKALGGFITWLYSVSGVTGPENITVIDKYTYKVTLDEPNGLIALLNCHSWSSILDSKAAKEHATEDDPWALEWIAKNNCGYSPYSLLEWRAGEYMTWEAREDWWAGEPKIKSIMIREIPESSNRVAMLESGAIDLALNLTPDELEYLKTNKEIKIINIKTANVTFMILNHKIPPFDNVYIRQAMVYAMPSEEIAKDVFKGYGTPMKSMIASMIPGTSTYWPYEYNLEKAKELLAKGGYPDGFTFEQSYDSSNKLDEAICVAWQASLDKIGVNMVLNALPFSTYAEKKYSFNLQAFMETGLSVQPDINFSTRLYFEPGGGNNWGNYSNDEVKELMIKGGQVLDPEERIAFHENIQKILTDEVCCVPVVENNLQIALRSNINGKLVYDTVNDFYWDTLTKE